MNGKELKSKRKQLGLSLSDVASDMCVTVPAVIHWESDRRNMSLSHQKLFCLLYGFDFKAFGCDSSASMHPDLFDTDKL